MAGATRAALPRRGLLLGLAALPLAGCGTNAESVWAPEDAVAAARWRGEGPPSLALITVRDDNGGQGVHSALLVNASERVLFDPFGRWTHPSAPERNDVLHGFSPQVEERYLAHQSSGGYYYIRQEKAVAPEVAEEALRLSKARGPVGMAMCTVACADVLRPLPGFESVGRPWLPEQLSDRFGRLPGVATLERRQGSAA